MSKLIYVKVNFLHPGTTTVDSGFHSIYVKEVLNLLREEPEEVILANKHLLTEMLYLSENWNEQNKIIYRDIYSELKLNFKRFYLNA
ncbi:hypothetical protein [Aliivibrio fischeri]|uniref:hypothetical protein n=1 Tax=Aliivibrio fischeri TaxID=668 RepID=UPI00031A4438|nr:hypothetical protein [Aliivibrio fischeri]OEE19874.1 hypothetical protein A1Q3_15710 [Aliivibrio fischeri ZF-211]